MYPAFVVVLGRFFNDISALEGNQLSNATAISSVLFVSIGCFALVLTTAQGVLWALIGEIISKSLKTKYFESLLFQNVTYFDQIDSSEPLQRLSGDIQSIQIGMSDKTGALIFSISQAIISFAVGFVLSWRLAAVLLAITPLFGCIGGIQFWLVRREQEKTVIRDTQCLKIPKEVTRSFLLLILFSNFFFRQQTTSKLSLHITFRLRYWKTILFFHNSRSTPESNWGLSLLLPKALISYFCLELIAWAYGGEEN